MLIFSSVRARNQILGFRFTKSCGSTIGSHHSWATAGRLRFGYFFVVVSWFIPVSPFLTQRAKSRSQAAFGCTPFSLDMAFPEFFKLAETVGFFVFFGAETAFLGFAIPRSWKLLRGTRFQKMLAGTFRTCIQHILKIFPKFVKPRPGRVGRAVAQGSPSYGAMKPSAAEVLLALVKTKKTRRLRRLDGPTLFKSTCIESFRQERQNPGSVLGQF